jgi:hypothetical protein
VNETFGDVLVEKTQEVFDFNRADLFPGETGFSRWESDMSMSIPPTQPATGPLFIADTIPVGSGVDANENEHAWDGETFHNVWPDWDFWDAESEGPGVKSWECWVELTFFPPYFSTVYMPAVPGEWYQLVNSGVLPHMYVGGVTAPATKALMFDDFFGPNAIPEMKAVAVSHPVGGSIEDGESTYLNRFMPVRRLMYVGSPFGSGEIHDSLFGRNRKVTH